MFALWKRYRYAAVAPLMLAMIATAAAQAPYPNRNITLVLPFAAGSGTDTTTRLIGKELGVALGVSMVIENKAGANGSIAASYVARSAPDGYTLFVTTNTTHSANPYLLKNMSYDPVKDFTPIARTGDLPFMLVIHPDIPAKFGGRTDRARQEGAGQDTLCQRQLPRRSCRARRSPVSPGSICFTSPTRARRRR